LDRLAGGAGRGDDDDPAPRMLGAAPRLGVRRERVVAGGMHVRKLHRRRCGPSILRRLIPTTWSAQSMQGKTCLVTGANRGIGYHVALGLAQRGARVLVHARTAARAAEAAAAIRAESGNDAVEGVHADFLH